MERGTAYENTLYKLETTYTTCNVLMVVWRERERERDKEGWSYN